MSGYIKLPIISEYDGDVSVSLKRIDEVNHSLSYIGYAAIGSATSDAKWRIQRVSKQGLETVYEYAGIGDFEHIWDDRTDFFEEIPYLDSYSLSFDGVNDYISLGDVYNFTSAEAWSFSLWFKVPNLAAERYLITNVSPDATRSGWRLGIQTDGKIVTQLRAAGLTNLATSWTDVLATDTWHHIVWTYSGGGNRNNQELFINGVKDSLVPASVSVVGMDNSTEPFYLGQSGLSSGFFVGNMSNFAVFGKALNQSEVDLVYNGGETHDLLSLSPSLDLRSWWRLGNGDFFPVVFDSKASFNGTMINMTEDDIEMDTP